MDVNRHITGRHLAITATHHCLLAFIPGAQWSPVHTRHRAGHHSDLSSTRQPIIF